MIFRKPLLVTIQWMLLLGFLLTISTQTSAQTPIGHPADLTRLQHFLDGLQTMEADFIQRLEKPNRGQPSETKGHFSTARPGKFRWEYQSPYAQTVLSDGKNLLFYEPDLMQVTLGSATRLDNTPALLLSSSIQIHTHFDWKVMEDPIWKLPSVQLFPKKKEGTIQEIVITLKPDQEELLQLVLIDSLGNRSHFYFHNTQINQPIPEKRFQFNIPPGVDVIQEDP